MKFIVAALATFLGNVAAQYVPGSLATGTNLPTFNDDGASKGQF